MTVLFLGCLLAYAALAAVAVFCARRRKALFWSDITAPVLVIALWVATTATGYGHQSLSHIIEVPIALLLLLVLLNIRVFVLDRYSHNHRLNSYIVLGISLLSVILLRTFMPYLPE